MGNESFPEPPRTAPAVPMHLSPAIVGGQAPADLEDGPGILESPAMGQRPRAWHLLVSSGSGRAGLALFAGMFLISFWVLATYPVDFGSARWSNPAYWANNPRNAPPIWASRLSRQPVFPQTSLVLAEPAEITGIPAGEVRLYRAPVAIDGDAAPTSLNLTLTGVTFQTRPPAILVSLFRPDGGQIRLTSVPIRGPRPGESSPFRRFYDVPERISLASDQTAVDAITRFFADAYPDNPSPPINQANVLEALFGAPSPGDSPAISPLPGNYALQVQAVVADPTDEIAPMGLTLGGTVFGIMGTDGLGRDIWQGLLYGFPVALLIAALTSLLSTLIGASLGVFSGFSGGTTDLFVQRASDIVSNVPTLPLLIFIVTVLGRHLWLIMLILIAFSWPGLAILVRAMVLQIRGGQLVEAARSMGAPRTRIMMRHVFPQVAPFIVAQMIFFAPGAILAEASLSFLGLGDPSVPTWGQMLEAGQRTGALYVGYWWWVLPPGILIVLTALAFMLLALALEPIVDPRLRRN